MIYSREFTSTLLLFLKLTDIPSLRYHKEQIEGDTNNYIHFRAQVTGLQLESVIMQVYNEAVIAQERVSKILYSTPAFIPWKRFINGFMYIYCSSHNRTD